MGDNILWYKKPATCFDEALPVGNGRIGGMVYGATDKEHIGLNEDSIWSGGLRHRINPDAREGMLKVRELLRAGKTDEAEHLAMDTMAGTPENSRHYMPLGNLDIFFGHDGSEVSSYRRRLDPGEAIAVTEYTYRGTGYLREVFVSAPDNVMVIFLKAQSAGKLSCSVSIGGRDDYFDDCRRDGNGNIVYSGGTGSADGIFFAAALNAACTGGSKRCVGNTIRIEDADEAVIVLGARSSFYCKDHIKQAVNDVEKALCKSYKELREAHIADYRALYGRVELDLDDNSEGNAGLPTDERLKKIEEHPDNKLMELYFNFGRYLMISGSRPGTQPLNLQGIWNDSMWPAWGSKFTVNINTEMNYWPAESCNLAECHEPLFDLLERVAENGHAAAKEMYGIDKGFVCHHNTDIWGDCAPQDKWIPATIWPMSGAWLALHVYEHYLYSLDKEFLKERFHLIKGAAEFFIDYLTEDEQGRLITGPSVSPENTYRTKEGAEGRMCMGPSMDSQILNCLFSAVIDCSEILDTDRELAAKLKEMRERLPQPEVGKYGQIKEWAVDYDEVEIGHRHISQLFALHPAELITPQKTPKLAQAARATLDRRLSHGGGHTGWSRAWIANMWARLHDKDKVYENLKKLLSVSTNPNMFDNHPPFQIDGNFGGTAAIAEALLQCTDGEIKLLPALPVQWSSGSVSGLRAKGGFTIDMSWSGGRLQAASVHAAADGNCRIRYDEESTTEISLKAGEDHKIK